MHGFGKLTSLKESIDIFNSINWKIPDIKEINVLNSCGFISAEDMFSGVSYPEFNRSAVDGYALNYNDILNASKENPSVLKVIGSVEAGTIFNGKINKNECVEVYTGALVPYGCNCIVMAENTEKNDDNLKVFSPGKESENIMIAGEDIYKGYKIISKGEKIFPQHVSAMIQSSIDKINVYSKLKISIINTGNELVNNKIKNTTQPLLFNYYKNSFIETYNGGISSDNAEDIKKLILKSLNSDIIIVTGGSSIGMFDNTGDSLSLIGDNLFSGVKIKPGKTIAIFNIDNKPVISVSGLPVAALISSDIYVSEYLKKFTKFSKRIKLKARITENINVKDGFIEFKRCFAYIEYNEIMVKPVKTSGSGSISSIIDGNAIMILEKSVGKNSIVDIIMLNF